MCVLQVTSTIEAKQSQNIHKKGFSVSFRKLAVDVVKVKVSG